MEQIHNLGDSRLVQGCIYCSGLDETKDHVPSKAFLDKPYPEYLPHVPCCIKCNNGFSLDEEYFVCLMECLKHDGDLSKSPRDKIKDILTKKVRLMDRITGGRTVQDGRTYYSVEVDRVQSVLLKLARGHSAYELNQVIQYEPASFAIFWVNELAPDQLEKFEEPVTVDLFGEIGSRGFQRSVAITATLQSTADPSETLQVPLDVVQDWITVQDSRYRYLAAEINGGILVRIVIGDILGCQVIWYHE